MNCFFHASPIFRFATGDIRDLDLAASEFNQSIYSYLRDKYGTLGATKTLARQGDAQFESIYRRWSLSRIRRELEKLKRLRPIVQGSPLCDKILFLSHKLRIGIKDRSQSKKPVTDRDFGTGFWPACRKLFADVVGASPTFSILECREYFSRVLAI